MIKKLCTVFLFINIGCSQQVSEDAIKDFMPGVYVRAIKQEYAVGTDTLFISLISRNEYAVNKKSLYHPVKKGKLLSPKSKALNWIAIFNEKNNLLLEQQHGKLISFDPINGRLFLGRSVYNKVIKK